MKLSEEIKKAKIESKKDFLNLKNIIPQIIKKEYKKDYSGKSNGIFVGEYGYPDVNVGVLSSPFKENVNDQKIWIKNNWKISEIAKDRFNLINSKKTHKINLTTDLNIQQELALSKKPSEVEINLKKQPKGIKYDSIYKPMGPSAELNKISLLENPKIPTVTQKITSDDLKAVEGLNVLYKKGFDSDYLVQTLTSGSLGEIKERKLVPTRWGITAVDDIIGKTNLNKIKEFNTTGNVLYRGNYLGNYFIILFFEGKFNFELFEFFKEVKEPTTDYENFSGRKNYAKETAGGYYATRFSLSEKLLEDKKQTQALVLRFITDEYYMPLGVWVVREAVKKTLSEKPIEFGSEELMLKYAELLSLKKFSRDISWLKKDSKLIKNRTQKKLNEF